MKLKLFYITLFILTSAFGFSQLKTITNKTTYPFWINVPEKESTEKQPVLIFLHGKSLSGTDLNRVRRYGVLRAMDKGRKIPAIVVAPQVAKGNWNPDKVLEVLEYVKKNYNVDESRIYVCGMSLGGYGTLHFAGKYADKSPQPLLFVVVVMLVMVVNWPQFHYGFNMVMWIILYPCRNQKK